MVKQRKITRRARRLAAVACLGLPLVGAGALLGCASTVLEQTAEIPVPPGRGLEFRLASGPGVVEITNAGAADLVLRRPAAPDITLRPEETFRLQTHAASESRNLLVLSAQGDAGRVRMWGRTADGVQLWTGEIPAQASR